jgi:predicted transcriptional regulator
MATSNDEIETVIFQALSHPMRRTIIRMLEANAGCSYTELITELQLPTGKMNYHLEQLDGLIEKNEQHRYVLSPLGKKRSTN